MSCKNSDNEIKKIILSIANSTISVTDITDNMNLIEDLNYDSIKMIQLIVEVEEKFNLFIDIENVPIKELYNVGTFINYVDILLSDLNRILPYYGVGKIGESYLFDYSRKLAYVGMSRPKKLLCVAMQDKTYEKSKGVFTDDWEIIDLRE